MVIFLNKVDLLNGTSRHTSVSVAPGLTKIMYIVAKLKAKVRFANYVISYGNRPNDYSSITSCTPQLYFELLPSNVFCYASDLKQKFGMIMFGIIREDNC